ncbi:hypothetical protein WOLCODRAFT_152661 [Wolfiporia cocos MD-104 SS10]|uniref:Uncharacterized protein n=1 Tax=Wolfiporia cocos (strain MD-104) TaxID=742152 RepID=A0A2H3JKC1_WOLCO|nr:hypothetical protein WOLCODRAFT_152661 [Wolfiporia cocos MD-104 SS10]
MDYLQVVFGIRVRGSVTSFNSIPPHVRPFINFNHTAYIKYYGEDSTRNHISWYPWDKYSQPMQLAELIVLYGDVHWYMEGTSNTPYTPEREESHEDEQTPQVAPLFGTLPALLLVFNPEPFELEELARRPESKYVESVTDLSVTPLTPSPILQAV